MTILNDPVRPFDPSSRLELVQTEAADAREVRPAPLDDPADGRALRRSSRPAPQQTPSDQVRSSMRVRGPRGKTTFQLASRGGRAEGPGTRS